MGSHPLTEFRLKQTPPLSRAELGDLLDVSRVTVFRWETGEREIDEARLAHVADKTGIPAKELRPDLAKLFAPEVAQ